MFLIQSQEVGIETGVASIALPLVLANRKAGRVTGMASNLGGALHSELISNCRGRGLHDYTYLGKIG